jgi:hypothetical protein
VEIGHPERQYVMMRYILLAALIAFASKAEARPQTDARTVREWVLQYHSDDGGFGPHDGYSVAYFDLNDDGTDEALVYLRSRSNCGSGGCAFYVLATRGERWERVSGHTITNLPVRILATRHRGWRDISVRTRIDARTSYHAALPFDGRTYPLNPSMPPARRLRPDQKGIVVIEMDTPMIRLGR